MGYVYLAGAILGELLGTNLLKASNGFTKLTWALGAILAYVLCFYWLSLAMKTINLNTAYALWAGVGIVITAILTVVIWHEPMSTSAIIGTGLILVGSILLNLNLN
ncbi:MAG: multidrug efflux SMR transporter [Lactobacillus sp.]|jgi:small multidrug resistance pump|nr:multidrug efflux SMR transporter [Lactobacillus sp.]